MDRRGFLAVTAAACTRSGAIPTSPKHRGLAFDGFRADVTLDDFLVLRDLGASHVAMTVWAFMPDPRQPTVRRTRPPDRAGSPLGETQREHIHLAREAGLAVYLVPTISAFRDGRLRSDIEMPGDAAWDEWFAHYGQFVNGVAAAAQAVGVEGLAVGMELRRTVRRADAWGRIVAAVRSRFGGWLTYAANWDDYESVPWWPAVDYLGVQAYFELGSPPEGDSDSVQAYLRRRWQPVRDRLHGASRRAGRPVVFSEIGYESRADATVRPWDWVGDGPPDQRLQADAYEAALQTFWDQPWFAGTYWWKWYARTRLGRRDLSRDYTPQTKAAETVLARWYRGARAG